MLTTKEIKCHAMKLFGLIQSVFLFLNSVGLVENIEITQ